MTPPTSPTHPGDTAAARPRVEGDREQHILEMTLDVLSDVGYDRLTMDAVASAARASKATLYRRWSTKTALVIDALLAEKDDLCVQDTGTLRGDLLGTFCSSGGLADSHQTAVLASVITAVMRDAEFAEAFRRRVIEPKIAVSQQIFERARTRGEIHDDVDIELLAPALAGTVMHRFYLLGEQPTQDLVTRVVDQIIMPAATRGAPIPQPTTQQSTQHSTQHSTEKDTP